jgi:hypothetical protein
LHGKDQSFCLLLPRLRAGARALPDEILWEFRGFYSAEVLSARWRIGQGNELSLQANAFRFGDRTGIALDNVVVLRGQDDASNLWLWAHELAHIEQYRRWGVDDFAKSYIRDADSIEAAANARANQFLAWRQKRLVPNVMPVNQTGDYPEVLRKGTSTICRFTTGPRAGQTQDFAPLQGIPISSVCQDGLRSTGIVVGAGETSNGLPRTGGGAVAGAEITTLCRFTVGPRLSQIQDYAPMQGIPVGSPCQDGMGSYGMAAASAENSRRVNPIAAQITTVCQFTGGPRQGQVQDFAPYGIPGIPVGSPCQDGMGSYGVGIPGQ